MVATRRTRTVDNTGAASGTTVQAGADCDRQRQRRHSDHQREVQPPGPRLSRQRRRSRDPHVLAQRPLMRTTSTRATPGRRLLPSETWSGWRMATRRRLRRDRLPVHGHGASVDLGTQNYGDSGLWKQLDTTNIVPSSIAKTALKALGLSTGGSTGMGGLVDRNDVRGEVSASITAVSVTRPPGTSCCRPSRTRSSAPWTTVSCPAAPRRAASW